MEKMQSRNEMGPGITSSRPITRSCIFLKTRGGVTDPKHAW